jgi:hypothetical protein
MGLLSKLTKTKLAPKRCPHCRMDLAREGGIIREAQHWEYSGWNEQHQAAEFRCPACDGEIRVHVPTGWTVAASSKHNPLDPRRPS